MATEHNTITDPNIHEPKGVSTATSGQVYVANGAGSGVWTDNPSLGIASATAGEILVADGAGSGSYIRTHGFGQFQDSRRTVGTPTQNIAAGVRTKWICDGGFLTVQKNPSDLLNPLWNTTTNKIVPIAEFDVCHIRLGFTAQNYAGATPYLEFTLDIGSPIGEIFWWSFDLRKGGSAEKFGFSFPVFTGSTFLANGGEIYVTYQGTGTCDLFAHDLMIVREGKNYV